MTQTRTSPNAFERFEQSGFVKTAGPSLGVSLGVVAMGSEVMHPKAYYAMMRLRGQVYLGRGYIGSTDVVTDSLGIQEIPDEYDERSIHLCIVRGSLYDPDPVALACARFIQKEDDVLLPVERHFGIGPIAPGTGFEVSRFIARESSARGLLVVCTMGMIQAIERTAYATLKPALVRLLHGMGVAAFKISGTLILEQYGNEKNVAVTITSKESIDRARTAQVSKSGVAIAELFERASVGFTDDVIDQSMQLMSV